MERQTSETKLLMETAENRQNRGSAGREGLAGVLWGCSREVDHRPAVGCLSFEEGSAAESGGEVMRTLFPV